MLRLCILFLLSISSSLVPQHLWKQICPHIIQHNHESRYQPEAILKQCCANALICHGQPIPMINPEQIQTIQSVHLLSEVLPTINQSNLQIGFFFLAKNMCQITAQPEILQQRQQLNTYLHNNPELVTQLNQLLATLQDTECHFLWAFYPSLSEPNSDNQANSFLELTAHLYRQVRKKLHSHIISAEYCQRATQLAVAATYLMTFGYIADFQICRHNTQLSWQHFLSKGIGKKYAEQATSNPYVSNSLACSAICVGLAQVIDLTEAIKKDFDNIYQMQTILIHIRQLIAITEKINKLLTQHPLLIQHIPQLNAIKNFTAYTHAQHSALSHKMIALLNHLHTPTFQGKPNYLFSFQGRILTTYNLYENIKEEFIPLWEALGEIDATIAVQNLLALPNNAYCIPTWTDQEKPYLEITNYWHPILGFEKSIKNSINLGNNTQPHNIILTGANAGGKTTTLTAIMIAQILAQSLGIAPAKSLTATPFARLHTYLDITTNLASHESLFIAQANRAQKLYHSITTCSDNEKCLSILDEIFTGTRADFAQQASFEFAKTLGQLPNSICILATHFPMLTELEKLNLFTNYCVSDATITENGELVYPYTVTQGISTQNIADHILKKKGLIS